MLHGTCTVAPMIRSTDMLIGVQGVDEAVPVPLMCCIGFHLYYLFLSSNLYPTNCFLVAEHGHV